MTSEIYCKVRLATFHPSCRETSSRLPKHIHTRIRRLQDLPQARTFWTHAVESTGTVEYVHSAVNCSMAKFETRSQL
eukprot:4039114-Amphidinium_carterae.1